MCSFVGCVKNFIWIEKKIQVAENRQKRKAEEEDGVGRVRGKRKSE